MNKKAFTLIELLAVIIILSILALITSIAITKMVKDSKETLSDTQLKLIELAAQTWATGNLKKLPFSGECSYILLQDLYDYGALEPDIIDSKTNQKLDNDLKIKIVNDTYSNKSVMSYEVNPNSIDGCARIYAVRPCGDIDDNGRIDDDDLYLLTQVTAGNIEVEDEDFKYMDVTGDGQIRANDRVKFLQFLSGTTSSLNCKLDD